jgi:integrase
MTTKVRAALHAHASANNVVITPFNSVNNLSTEGTVVLNDVGKATAPKSLEATFHVLTKRAGLPRIKIHAMRHTAATVFKDNNVPVKDVQMILGHANISTTLNIYQHGSPENYAAAISAMENQLLPA